MSTIGIQQLFQENRFPAGWRLLPLILYTPIGLILAILRSFIGFQVLFAAAFLPHVSVIRSMILRTLCFVLGIIIREESTEKRDTSAQVIVANHISLLDYIPVHVLTGCITPGKWEAPSAWALNLRIWGEGDALTANLRSHVENTDIPVLIQPEGSTTACKKGLLKFEPWPMEASKKVQPAVIRAWRPPMTDVAVTVLAASELWDIFFYLFVPFTVYTVRYLNVIELDDGVGPAHGMERVETEVAKDLDVQTTKFTVKDKAEYEKRYLAELYRTVTVTTGSGLRLQPTGQQMQRMSNQVKEVLPYVPLDVIRRDLARTWDVDLTITNILEGVVPYVPEGQPQDTSTSASARGPAPSSSPQTSKASEQALSSSLFSKSPKDRALSFQERKAQMIAEARKKYIIKHGLQIPDS